MAYSDRFIPADELINHLDSVVTGVSEEFKSRYVGFLAISIVTVYELALKDIFCEFAAQKHKVFGNFTTSYFDQINGRIKIRNIKEEYLKKFGQKYLDRFEKKLEKLEKTTLASDGTSIKSSYGNIITWRHSFVHQGNIPATYDEVKKSYRYGKLVLSCLADCMSR